MLAGGMSIAAVVAVVMAPSRLAKVSVQVHELAVDPAEAADRVAAMAGGIARIKRLPIGQF